MVDGDFGYKSCRERMTTKDTEETADSLYRQYVENSANDFLLFARGLMIPSATGPQLFKDCIADFQLEFLEAIAKPLQALRDGTMPKWRRFWLERTKKASKDADLALIVAWLMAFPKRPFKIQIIASNQKQAGIVKTRIEDLLHFNLWLKKRIRVVQNRIMGTTIAGGLVKTVIEATGTAGGAHGETPDLLILNELVHVERWNVMETHRNNADGVPQGIVIISTNAGFKGTKAEVWRKIAIKSKRWLDFIWHKIAPWVDPEDVKEAKDRNDPFEYSRLWLGKWISGRGGAVTEEDMNACFREDLQPLTEAENGWLYGAGLDLGISHDHAGIVVVGANAKESRIKIGYIRDFPPSVMGGGEKLEVDIEAVEAACVWAFKTFNLGWFGYDPAAGGSFTAQRLIKLGVPMQEMTFSSPSNLKIMGQCFVQALKERKLECFESEEMRRDMGKFEIEAKVPSGFVLKAVSDEYGHADVGTALVIALPHAMELLGYYFSGDHVYSMENKEPLSDEEIDDLPDEFKELYAEDFWEKDAV